MNRINPLYLLLFCFTIAFVSFISVSNIKSDLDAKQVVCETGGKIHRGFDDAFANINIELQKYIDENVLLFSNLFGPIFAKDKIPDYKYKQGAKLPELNVEKYYNEYFYFPLYQLKKLQSDYQT